MIFQPLEYSMEFLRGIKYLGMGLV